jgi:hypothetical protein
MIQWTRQFSHRDLPHPTEQGGTKMSTNRIARVTRRRFLKNTGLTLAAAGSAPLLSAPFVSKALADNKSLSIVQWAHFVQSD